MMRARRLLGAVVAQGGRRQVGLIGLWRKKGRLLPRYSTTRVLFTRRRLRGRESGG